MRIIPDQIFIPGGLPQETYVSREHLNIEETLRTWLQRSHKPLLSVSGPTKSGKTVLLKKVVHDGIWLSGGAIHTLDDFWAGVCEELEVFTDHTVTGSTSSSTHAGGSLSVPLAKANADRESSYSNQISRTRSSEPKQAARKALKRNPNRTVVIDDFHYINPQEQELIVRGLKDLIFDGLGVIVASVPHRAYDVVRVEKEMTGRVDILRIENWESRDLSLIGTQGFESLGVTVDESILKQLVDQSFKSPHLMQTHCLNLCQVNTNEGSLVEEFAAPEWPQFFESQASATAKTAFDLLKKGPPTRDRAIRKLKNGTETDIYGAVLTAIENTGPKTSISYDEIRSSLRETLESEQPQRNEVTNVLGQMNRIAREKIDGEPVIEYDEEYSTLHLIDPYFAYYLRWASPAMKDIVVTRR